MRSSSRLAVAAHVLALLDRAHGEPLTSEYIASCVATHPVVIRRIGCMLSRAGLVTSRLGTGGGFRLARPSDRIALREVYLAVERRPLFAMPGPPDPGCAVGAAVRAALDAPLRQAERALEDALSDVTVADLARTTPRRGARSRS
jgi:Rrf2 family protein